MAFFTVAVISALCLILPMTRVYGLVGAGILLYFFPVPTIGILLICCAAYYFFQK